MILNIGLPVYAAVYTVPSDSGEADTVYVAGNPNAYPLEYYSKEDKAFCGVFPDMLKVVSEKTGISFTYISASNRNGGKGEYFFLFRMSHKRNTTYLFLSELCTINSNYLYRQ